MNWNVECKRVFVPTGNVRKNGKEELMPIDVRTMFIKNSLNVLGPKEWKVTVVKRGGRYKFGLHHKPIPKKEVWKTLKLVVEPEPDWVRFKDHKNRPLSFSEQEITKELRNLIGVEAEDAVWTLLTAIPENLAA